jgi:hypothetical protein
MRFIMPFILCIITLFFTVPALAGPADAPVVPEDKAKVSAPVSRKAGDKAEEKTEHWVSLSASSRPAYVGIHGGTAPISLFRNENGELVAMTGQTGNDFSHLLSGGNSSLRALPQTDNEAASQKATPVEAGDSVTISGDELPSPVQTSDTAPSRSTVAKPTSSAPTAATPAAATPAASGAVLPHPALAGGSASSLNGAVLVPVPLDPSPSCEILPNISAANATIVFASGSVRLSSDEKLTPFGLTVADAPSTVYVAQDSLGSIAKPAYAPLRLHDYRRALANNRI